MSISRPNLLAWQAAFGRAAYVPGWRRGLRRSHTGTVADDMRSLMRCIPQPVAVVVTQLPDGTYHGATLSSFTSVSLSPPLVSFSLRLPSRLASALQHSNLKQEENSVRLGGLQAEQAAEEENNPDRGRRRDDRPFFARIPSFVSKEHVAPPPPLHHPPFPSTAVSSSTSASTSASPLPKRFTVSLLSSHQSDIARTFSQARGDHEAALKDLSRWDWGWGWDKDQIGVRSGGGVGAGRTGEQGGLPVLRDGMGALLCEVAGWKDLRDFRGVNSGSEVELEFMGGRDSSATTQQKRETDGLATENEPGSMLFLARVMQVMPSSGSAVGPGEGGGKGLIYERQRYVVTQD